MAANVYTMELSDASSSMASERPTKPRSGKNGLSEDDVWIEDNRPREIAYNRRRKLRKAQQIEASAALVMQRIRCKRCRVALSPQIYGVKRYPRNAMCKACERSSQPPRTPGILRCPSCLIKIDDSEESYVAIRDGPNPKCRKCQMPPLFWIHGADEERARAS